MSTYAFTSAERPTKLPDFLLVLRAFAGIVVVLLHVYGGGIVDGSTQESLLHVGSVSMSWVLSGAAHPGVYLFFVLSGYLMGKGFVCERYPLTMRGGFAFYWARFLRIYPPLAFYLLAVITLGHAAGTTAGQTYGAIVGILSLHWTNAYDVVTGWFGHLWTIVTECQLYLAAPFLAALVLRVRSRTIAMSAIASLAIVGLGARAWIWSSLGIDGGPWTQADADAWQSSLQQPLITNLDLFVSGMLINKLTISNGRAITGRSLAIVFGGLAAFYLACAYVTHYALFVPDPTMRLVWAVVLPTASLAFGVVAIVVAETINAGRFVGRLPAVVHRALVFFAYLGELTYGIYLWHLIVLGSPLPFSRSFAPVPNLLVNDLSTYAIATIVAIVVHNGIEVPFDRFKRLVPARPAALVPPKSIAS